MAFEEKPLWPHQERGLAMVTAAMNRGVKRIVASGPTGSGKSRMMVELIRWGQRTVVYSNRKMLLEQLAAVLDAAGVSYGIRASGHRPSLLDRVQLSSIQTEEQRVYQQEKWDLHGADLVIVDEAHAQTADVAGRILQDHAEQGATILGLTATPLDLAHIYEELIVFANTSDCRACGALVPCVTFAPNEPAALLKPMDKKHPQKAREPLEEEITEPKAAKAMPPAVLFGSVFEHWKLLNPDARPTILFAPGVNESLYFAQQFYERGVKAAHIDGNDVWINGEWYPASGDVRKFLRDEAESGRVKVVCNRYVLREGIDWPFLYHGIFATAFGSPATYLQSGGRLLRAHPSLDHVIIQDHGGNWWRHGSLNSDREWSLDYSERIFAAIRKRRLRNKEEAEPIRCPRCHAIRLWGRECPKCRFVCGRARPRMVLETDGTLREMEGDIYKPRRIARTPLIERKWQSCYHRARHSDMTFEQARALCAKESRWQWPAEDLAFMPLKEIDWFKRVKDVPYSALRGEKNANQRQEG